MDRINKLEGGREIDWATAEALALGTLLLQGEIIHVYLTIQLVQ